MVQTEHIAFSQYATDLRRQIDAALAVCATLGPACPERLGEAIRYSLLGPGKRLRPMLVLMAAEACGAAIQQAMPAACAVEMVHAYSLVHDDLPAMDDDDLRRGRPTCHKVYGDAMAILVGDALLALAFETMTKLTASATVVAACCASLARAAGPCALVGGQADDLQGLSAEAGLERLQAIHERKTGALISVSLQLGGLVAGANPQHALALERYGQSLGLAFQITDDLLDVRGEEGAVGKRLGKDDHHGKLTFPQLLGIDQSAARARELIDEAREALIPLGQWAERLDALASYVLERNR